MRSGGNFSAQTAAIGTNYTAFAVQACMQLTIVNDTGVSIEFQQNAAGVAIPIVTGDRYTIFGIVDASVIGVRRVDNSNTQVTVKARWEN